MVYMRVFRPDETVPRIIKLAKYFRATAVITQLRGRGSFYSLSSSAGEAEPPASVRTMDRWRNMDAHLSPVYAYATPLDVSISGAKSTLENSRPSFRLLRGLIGFANYENRSSRRVWRIRSVSRSILLDIYR